MPNSRKPVILTFVKHYLPGAMSGGPVRTIANMADQLGGEFLFRIVTSDRDAMDTEPYPGIARETWVNVGNAEVYYLPPDKLTLRDVTRLICETKHDALYLNSFFDPVFTQAPLLARWFGWVPRRPVVVAPRGEFSPGALEIFPVKKAAFIRLARRVGLYGGVLWQASCQEEADDIRQSFGILDPTTGRDRRIRIALDLSEAVSPQPLEAPVLPPPARPENGSLRVLFLSRITPKKNLDLALRVLAKVRAPVAFDIYGPIREPTYWQHCEALIAQCPPHVTVTYRGALEHEDVAAAFASYDLFFLPTRGENFGHVMMESLMAGTPVLIADTTPWRGLEAAGVGWDLPLADEADFGRKVEFMAGLPVEERAAMRQRARAYARSKAADPAAQNDNRELLQEAIAGDRQFLKEGAGMPKLPRGAWFHEQHAAHWSAGYAGGGFRKRLRAFNAILDRLVRPGQRWLDLGCGSGVLSVELTRRGASVVAVDGSPAMVAAAHKLFAASPGGAAVTLREGDVQDLSWAADGSFDGVLCSSVVEYVEQPDRLLAECSRVLKTDGQLILSVPPTMSFVRSAQRVVRRMLRAFGRDRYAYLDVSWFEIAPSAVRRWLATENLRTQRVTKFDVVLGTYAYSLLRPSLLICEAVKVGVHASAGGVGKTVAQQSA